MNKYYVVDSSDHKDFYGYIESNYTNQEIQKAINEIKNSMSEEEYCDYTVHDIVKELYKKGINVNFVELGCENLIEI